MPQKRTSQYSPFYVGTHSELAFFKELEAKPNYAQGGSFRFQRIVHLQLASSTQKFFWKSPEGEEHLIGTIQLEYIQKQHKITPYTGHIQLSNPPQKEELFFIIPTTDALEAASRYTAHLLLAYSQVWLEQHLGEGASFEEPPAELLASVKQNGKQAFQKPKEAATSAAEELASADTGAKEKPAAKAKKPAKKACKKAAEKELVEA